MWPGSPSLGCAGAGAPPAFPNAIRAFFAWRSNSCSSLQAVPVLALPVHCVSPTVLSPKRSCQHLPALGQELLTSPCLTQASVVAGMQGSQHGSTQLMPWLLKNWLAEDKPGSIPRDSSEQDNGGSWAWGIICLQALVKQDPRVAPHLIPQSLKLRGAQE